MQHFFDQPLWFTIPIIVVYAAVVGCIIYTLLRYRRK